jgi:hypothetical protein
MSKAIAVAGQYETLGRGLILLGAFVGVLVTVFVAIGVGLPIYGAILDGRYQPEREGADVIDLSNKQTGSRPAA